jgi:hypothetical protein
LASLVFLPGDIIKAVATGFVAAAIPASARTGRPVSIID